MRMLIALLIVGLTGAGPTAAVVAQRDVTAGEEIAALKRMAAAIPPGARVRVHLANGRRMTATLMSVSDEGVVVKRHSRVPEPALAIRFDELARLQRDDRGGGFSLGKAVGVGLAAGAGAILTMFAIALSLDD